MSTSTTVQPRQRGLQRGFARTGEAALAAGIFLAPMLTAGPATGAPAEPAKRSVDAAMVVNRTGRSIAVASFGEGTSRCDVWNANPGGVPLPRQRWWKCRYRSIPSGHRAGPSRNVDGFTTNTEPYWVTWKGTPPVRKRNGQWTKINNLQWVNCFRSPIGVMCRVDW